MLKFMHSPFSILLALFLLQAASVHAGRPTNNHSNARRSLPSGHKRRLAPEAFEFVGGNVVENNHLQVRKRQNDGILDGLFNPVNQGLGDLGNGLASALPTTALVPAPSFPPAPGPEPTSASLTSASLSESSTFFPSSTFATSSQPTSVVPSSSTEPPTSSTSSDGGILGPITSILLPPPSSSAESSASQPTEAPSSQPTEPPTSSTSSGGGIFDTLSSVIGGVTSDLSSVLESASSTAFSSEPTTPPSSSSAVEPPTPSSESSGSISIESSGSISIESSGSITSEPPGPSISVNTSSTFSESSGPSISVSVSSTFSISFPDGNSSTIASSTESGPASTSFTPAPSTPSSTTTTTSVPFSVNSDFSFILTESDLAFTSIPTPTSLSMTNPDEPTTTLGSISSAAPAATFSAAPLPAGLPSRIYPKNGYKAGDDVTGFTLISLLFSQELNWPFVANDDRSSFQIFGYMPAILNTCLGLTGDRATITWMLQVYVPSSYRGPSDIAELGTTYLAYIPTDQVNNLAAMIKAPQSAFYTSVDIAAARSLALLVNSGYSLLSVPDPNGGDGGQTRSSGNSNSSGSTDRTRQDAIIGVVSALGAIAVLVLAFLVYKWYQRRQEAAHRRLSDPVAGARPDGREFDQDSLGGQRRRSFYFAEDSLRGFQEPQQEEYSYHHDQNGVRTSPVGGVMTQRRNVVPAAISQPILRESSMNW